MLVGLGSALGVVAAIFHIVNHATFKASLFMAAGAVDHEAGTRDMRRLGGLRRFMPITATLALIAGAAMAGVPLLNGFLSKEMFFAETLAAEHGAVLDIASVVIAVAASAFGVTYSLRFVRGVFFGRVPADLPREPHEPPLLDAVADRPAGAGLPAGRHAAGAGDRAVAACGGERGAGRATCRSTAWPCGMA